MPVASNKPAARAAINPMTISSRVTSVCPSSKPRLAANSRPIADGAGSCHLGMSHTRTPISQRATRLTRIMTGAAQARTLDTAEPVLLRLGLTVASTVGRFRDGASCSSGGLGLSPLM